MTRTLILSKEREGDSSYSDSSFRREGPFVKKKVDFSNIYLLHKSGFTLLPTITLFLSVRPLVNGFLSVRPLV